MTREDHVPLRFEIQSDETKLARLKAAETKRQRRSNREPLSGLTLDEINDRRKEHFADKQAAKKAAAKQQRAPSKVKKLNWSGRSLYDTKTKTAQSSK